MLLLQHHVRENFQFKSYVKSNLKGEKCENISLLFSLDKINYKACGYGQSSTKMENLAGM